MIDHERTAKALHRSFIRAFPIHAPFVPDWQQIARMLPRFLTELEREGITIAPARGADRRKDPASV